MSDSATADPDRDLPEEIRWQGKFVVAKQRGRWEYVARARNIRAAVILALDGEGGDRSVILVEQYRMPLGQRCLELPAGLIGDETEDEEAEATAARELEEETGYRAGKIEAIGDFASSPGMLSETFTLVRATQLAKVGDGGGVDHEEIVTHRVRLADVTAFVERKRREGLMIDVKLLLLLGGGMLAV
ncbi:MAG: NUDIX hydrolase [Sphingomonadaceae bacterium]|nr:NUDIX hydrolase [Sphingomonadaceae bacterium]